MLLRVLSLGFVLIMSWQSMLAQEGWEDLEDEVISFTNSEINEGVFETFSSFQQNRPKEVIFSESKSNVLVIKDSSGNDIKINARKIWGFYRDGELYVSDNFQFWKCLEVGRLLLYNIVEYRSSGLAEPTFGASNLQRVEISHFIDTKDGTRNKLNIVNLDSYLSSEASLKNYKVKINNKRATQATLLLIAYNQLNPLKIGSYE
tara:strand:- start:154 stop:765 length:612 start_codon:yes stop_codon:yes gene_type:complete